MMSANDIAWGMTEFMRLWHSLVITLTVFSVMFGMCTVMKLHNMAKAELVGELCISTFGRDCESAKDNVSM